MSVERVQPDVENIACIGQESQDTTSCTEKLSWKQMLRMRRETKLLPKKPIQKLKESSRSKNIPKNISKAIIQLALQTDIVDRMGYPRNEVEEFVRKNRDIQNLQTLLRLSKEHKNERINTLHEAFRKICWFFLKKEYASYVFNSKVKDPQWHLRYRDDLMRIFRAL